MTPHMQSSAAKSSSSRKSHGKKHMLGDIEQGSHSIELWKKAFMDACERLCPIRAGGHECACLSVLTQLVSIIGAIFLPALLYSKDFCTVPMPIPK